MCVAFAYAHAYCYRGAKAYSDATAASHTAASAVRLGDQLLVAWELASEPREFTKRGVIQVRALLRNPRQ